MKKSIILLLLVATVSGCQAIQNLAGSIQKPSLSIKDVQVTDFAFDEIELTYEVEVDNPNPVALQMLSYDYDFNINNNDFVEGSQDKQLRIESSGTSTFEIPMRINFQELYELFSSLRNDDKADYSLMADLHFDLPIVGNTTIPLEKRGTVPLIKLPEIAVSSLEVDDISFSEANLILNLDVENPNGFGLLMNAFAYDLNVNGNNWVEGKSQKAVKITENDSNRIAIPISLDIEQIGTSALQLLNNSSGLNYKLSGRIDFGATHPLLESLQTKFSVDKMGDVPLIR